MCYGMCPYENPITGECKGPIDWSKPDAACVKENDFETDDRDDVELYAYGFTKDESFDVDVWFAGLG